MLIYNSQQSSSIMRSSSWPTTPGHHVSWNPASLQTKWFNKSLKQLIPLSEGVSLLPIPQTTQEQPLPTAQHTLSPVDTKGCSSSTHANSSSSILTQLCMCVTPRINFSYFFSGAGTLGASASGWDFTTAGCGIPVLSFAPDIFRASAA